jgi:hypothetical protein
MYGMKLEPYDTYSLASALLRERVGEQMALTMILGDAATRKDEDVSVAAGKPSPANDYRMSDGRPIFGEDSPHDIGKHLAEVCQGEIPVNRDLLRAAIYADIDHGITGTIPSGRTKNDLTDSIMGTIAPFLASPEPVSIDLEDMTHIANAAFEKLQPKTMDYSLDAIEAATKAVLDAAGVKYVD